MTIHEILKQYWGYDSFRPLQEDIVTAVLNKNDTLALLPTGGGKSICFQVPAMAMPGICIVVSPLIALMKDQVENLQKKGINAIAIISGMGKREIDIALDNCIYGPVKFLYISPERLATDLVRERIKHMKVNLFAVDEAHCISQWGYDFRPPYLQLTAIRTLHPEVPMLALTASATEQVQADIMQKLDFKHPKVFRKSFERTNLSYSVLNLENKLQKLIEICQKVPGSGIVYVKTRKDTVEIAKYLYQYGISASYYHAGLDADARSKSQQMWISSQLRIMVATNAFGMGIDKPDVRLVIHYEMPESLEAYYQEAGRAGRDEQKAFAVLLYQKIDKLLFEKRFEQNFPPLEEVRRYYHLLCNYLQIPFEAGEGVMYEFQVGDFCQKFQLDVITALSAVKTLEQNGYITLSEQALLPSRIQFLVNGEDLYKFQVEQARYDLFIKSILRIYGGAFDYFVAIKEVDLASKNQIRFDDVVKMLQELHDLGVISYIKKTDKPLLTFLKPRYKTEDLYLDFNFYKERKNVYQTKMTAMLAYVTQDKCRSEQILSYFNETDTKACGICDVCIHKKRSLLKAKMMATVLENLAVKPLSLEDLVKTIKMGSEKDKLNVIRLLLEAGDIFKSEEGYQLKQ
ncbi:RecQ family ATP-dependent DNA helicase [Pedobacter glucosidilyticus]|uniref:RecQ family ATP-dependent DNA helicase n=1 Tax=Pedobacter glucosidilyticus TaxID=1122941 RepID=UPI0026F28DA8|nr:ATP-dependent DNA helicase RecQ [Pedobacter glucosidilyticus]